MELNGLWLCGPWDAWWVMMQELWGEFDPKMNQGCHCFDATLHPQFSSFLLVDLAWFLTTRLYFNHQAAWKTWLNVCFILMCVISCSCITYFARFSFRQVCAKAHTNITTGITLSNNTNLSSNGMPVLFFCLALNISHCRNNNRALFLKDVNKGPDICITGVFLFLCFLAIVDY